MAKQQQTTIPSGATASKAINPPVESTASNPKHEQIARLAYYYWQDEDASMARRNWTGSGLKPN
jgi:hypothetical protein